MSSQEPNIFPGNWTVKTREIMRSYELSFSQQWNPLQFKWEQLDPSNFEEDRRIAQAYWFAKLAFFEKSGIGAFGYGMVKAAELGLEDPIKKSLASITYDQCRHDEVCRRMCNKLCPNFPYSYKPRNKLEEKALRNIMAIYDNGRRYWKGFLSAWAKYRPQVMFAGFFFAEIGAEVIFSSMRNKSRIPIYVDIFTNIARDESRHLLATISLLKAVSNDLSEKERYEVTRLLKQGFIFLSPLLFKPKKEFWKLPDDFVIIDQKMEDIAYEAGLGTLTHEEKVEAWRKAIEKRRREVEDLGFQLPSIPEIGIDGIDVEVKKGETVMGTF